jgi:hypothetical protein
MNQNSQTGVWEKGVRENRELHVLVAAKRQQHEFEIDQPGKNEDF